MAEEIISLRKEHANFKKLLNLLDVQLDLLHKGKDADFQLMTDILYYITQYYDICLHPKEELVFSFLVERDPTVKDSVTEITKQHQTICEYGTSIYEKLENIINDASEVIKLRGLETSGRQYITTLRTHMDKEEQDLFVRADQLLSDDDWKTIKTKTQTKPDPIFGETIEDRFHLVCDQLGRSPVTNKCANASTTSDYQYGTE